MTTPDADVPSKPAFEAHLADARFPATRDDLADAAAVGRAPTWVLDLLANLDDQAPFTSIDQVWDEAAGPDGS